MFCNCDKTVWNGKKRVNLALTLKLIRNRFFFFWNVFASVFCFFCLSPFMTIWGTREKKSNTNWSEHDFTDVVFYIWKMSTMSSYTVLHRIIHDSFTNKTVFLQMFMETSRAFFHKWWINRFERMYNDAQKKLFILMPNNNAKTSKTFNIGQNY